MNEPGKQPNGAESGTPVVRLGAITAALLIIANMIGVGVFTTTGYMVSDIGNGPAVLTAWLLGGIAALCGALTYAELGAALPRNGGEYQMLSRIYHPAIGFVAGCVSLVVGFSAPVASYGIAFGDYLARAVPAVGEYQTAWDARLDALLPWLAAAAPQAGRKLPGMFLICICALIHALHMQTGSRFHNTFTVGKILFVAGFIAAGVLWGDPARIVATPERGFVAAVLLPQFAISLVFVSFSYQGWNAAAYAAGEIDRPERNLPRAVIVGTCTVGAMYVLLNATFLAAAPAAELAGQHDVAYVAAAHLLGEGYGRFAALTVVLGLVSTVSAMLFTGPRVYEAMGRDFAALRLLAVRRAGGGPVAATALQTGLSLLMMFLLDLETLLRYIGFTLSLFTSLTVAGVFVLRWREPALARPYRTLGFPITPLLFLALEGWMIVHAIRGNMWVALFGLATVAASAVLYPVTRWLSRNRA
jgi:basic amino acid/polyamine antiporter, APA family